MTNYILENDNNYTKKQIFAINRIYRTNRVYDFCDCLGIVYIIDPEISENIYWTITTKSLYTFYSLDIRR